MLTRLRRWWTDLPLRDPAEPQPAARLQVLLIGLLLAVSLIVALNALVFWIDLVAILACAIGALAMLRLGRLRWAVWTVIAGSLLILARGLFALGLAGHESLLILFVIPMTLSGLLVGRRGLLFTLGSSLAIVLGAFGLQQSSAPRLVGPTTINAVVAFALVVGLLGLLFDRFGLAPAQSQAARLPEAGAQYRPLTPDLAERQQTPDELRRLIVELEKRLAERTAQLQAANQELEAFSYSVSHDLRAPLRALDGFSRVLLERHAAALPAEAARYLHNVRQNAQDMNRLIDHLLDLSRLSRQPLARQPVAPADLVRQALAGLGHEREGRRVDIVIGDLPACQADPALLKQVWVNLLSNALKFTRRREAACIEIGCQPRGEEQVYFVRDNGTGFDMRYAHKLFGLFQRLHRAEDYEGAGAGLAVVRRVIQRHGGRVWAEAEVDRGATFYFTLGQETPPG